MPGNKTNLVSSGKQQSIFAETFSKLFKENKESNMFDRFSSLSSKEKILAVSAVGVMVGALLPFVAVALPVAATGAIVALTLFFAYKAVEYTFKGLKWSAEKTVEGAKYTAEKVKDASVYTAEKAREGYYSVKGAISSVGRATREGAGATLGKMGRSLSNLSESMSSLDAIPYSIGNEGQTVVLKTEEKTRNFNSVKEMFIKEVLEDKAVNSSALTKEIFSKLGEKILEKAYSVDGQSGFQKDQLINQLKQQADFVNKLDAKKLQNLLSKDNNSLYEIFSEHHDEIKRIVKECKIEHKLSNSIENLNKVAGKYSIREGATQSIENSLSKSSSLDSVRTDSTEPPIKVGNSTFYVDTPTPIENTNKTATIGGRPGVARRGSTGNLTRVGTPEVSTRSASLTNLNELNASSQNSLSEEFGSNPIRADNEVWYDAVTTLPDKGTLTHSNSTDSGMGSGSSTPTRKQVLPFDRELEEKLAKRRASLDQPSAEPVNSRATATPGTV
ncbi:actin-bundling T4SS effector WalE1 family protein [Wolbachia endosymbiont (group A) of Volucella inflata]|uniref:actin-bundling T4SS effector WalE1 family protein n=1 Tax=Wolbachia endosymbiont (group A) of Volucella inflata TaxID=2954065 RepID=UPI0022269F44|nr:hypothetical protein [Wolbachia endosymbiont (group A) of Volucella inflata]